MISAVTIDGLDKMEQKEHFFNDVKYATVSLDKDIRQINEQFEEDIYQLDVAALKKRLQEEYSELTKPTYGFLRLEGFSTSRNDLNEYLEKTNTIYNKSIEPMQQIAASAQQLAGYGLRDSWDYQKLTQLCTLFDSIRDDVIPTRYWFDVNKYDFIQELMNETQTKVEEYLTASKKVNQTWSQDVLKDDSVAALDYYIERKNASLKIFDLNFHKSKKILKELFVDEYRTFQDSEIEELHKNVYTIKRNEFWLTKNQTRIQQFLGAVYQGTDTDFQLLRTQYAIFQKLGTEFTREDSKKQFATAMIEEQSYVNLTQLIIQLKEVLNNVPFDELLAVLPCDTYEAAQTDVGLITAVVGQFHTVLVELQEDYDRFDHCRLEDCGQKEFTLDDMRKVIYCLERIAQKQDWLKKYQLKVKELFRNEAPSMDTDWTQLKEKLFHTDLKDNFPVYKMVDKDIIILKNGGQLTLADALREVLLAECPMAEEILYRRIVSVMDLVRMTPKMKQELISLMEDEFAQDYFIEDGYVYAVNNSDLLLRIPEEGEEKRDISLVPPRELKAGIITLIDVEYELTLDAIGKGIAGLLGYPRRTKKFNDYVESAVRELSREDKIKRYSGGFRILTY